MSETPSKSSGGKSRLAVEMFLRVSWSVSPPKGENPVRSTYARTPRLQMSAASVIGSRLKISGAGKLSYVKWYIWKCVWNRRRRCNTYRHNLAFRWSHECIRLSEWLWRPPGRIIWFHNLEIGPLAQCFGAANNIKFCLTRVDHITHFCFYGACNKLLL